MQMLLDSAQLAVRPVDGDWFAGERDPFNFLDRQPQLKNERRHRVPQLVRDGRDELVASGYGVLQFLEARP